ncbi:heterokaryon incompatibility protein-domain-containing protein [Amylocarpus encephaloides]|uniref:Heterokaryon incompatibility protein-domain-containing protein n=1 Tax=Amylocarpus encephaloides TaxID=45428 RepID=A0A9P7YUF4_9HELO|nr:heterokaryon incompatibility protein-domain-containing protein [Amylocarpus encephaloides]
MAYLASPRRDRDENSLSPSRLRLGNTAYKYERISFKQNEIRLLRVLPGRPGDRVECELFIESLDRPRAYSALSYTWGIKEDTALIYVHGHSFPVTRNCKLALERLRLPDRTVILWIDLLCIDQKNIKERNHQVQKMMLVYQRARRINMWLGPENDDSIIAFDLIWDLYNDPDSLVPLARDPRNKNAFKSLVNLFEREYWKRIWVVQEVLNARKIAVYCGADAISWSKMTYVSELFGENRPLIIQCFNKFVRKDNGWDDILISSGPHYLDRVRGRGNQSDLLETLSFHRRKLCQDPKDKVYGILGILSERERGEFEVDYDLSTRQVYINVAIYILHVTRCLDVLGHSIPREPNANQLPSWVPDWEQRSLTRPMSTVAGKMQHIFSAGGDTLADFRILDNGDALELDGVILGRVAEMGSPLSELTAVDTMVITFHHWRSILSHSKSGLVTPDDDAAFARTITCGIHDGETTPSQLVTTVFEAFASLTRETSQKYILDAQMELYADSWDPSREAARTTLLEHTLSAIQGRRFFVTEDGEMGMGPWGCDEGDLVVVPLGCSTPVVLREEGGGRGRDVAFVGDAYVNGFMFGKAIRQLDEGRRREEGFVIR